MMRPIATRLCSIDMNSPRLSATKGPGIDDLLAVRVDDP